MNKGCSKMRNMYAKEYDSGLNREEILPCVKKKYEQGSYEIEINLS